MLRECRLVIPDLAGTALTGPLTWLAALDETSPPAIHTPAGPASSVRILATVSGSAVLEDGQRDVHLRPGGLVLLDAGWAYRRRTNREPWRVRAVLLAGAWAERLSLRLAPAGGVAEYRRPPVGSRERITTIVEAALAARRGWDWVVAAELARLLPGLCAVDDPAEDGLVGRVSRLVAAEPDRSWRVATLARALGCSESAFAHRFAGEAGIPPARWLRRWRVGRAKRLLAEHPPGEVSTMLGFATPFHFSRVFRDEVGIPPTAWREQVRV